jgi:hypothetical protein
MNKSKLLFLIMFPLGLLFQFSINVGYAADQLSNPGIFLATGDSYMNGFSGPPLLALSNDSGLSWRAIVSDTHVTSVKKSSCAGSGSNAFCVAIVSLNTYPYTYDRLAISQNTNTLEIKSDVSTRNKIQFSEISCTGSMHPICILGGTYIYHGQERQILLASENKGQTWEELNDSISTITAFHCSGESPDIICTTTKSGLMYDPVFYLSTDAGKTWQSRYIQNPSEYLIDIHDMNCNENHICIGFGYKTIDRIERLPILTLSTDMGETWNMLPNDNSPKQGEFTATSCTTDNINCVTIGRSITNIFEDFRNWSPIITVSNDSGITWKNKEIKSKVSLKGELSNISCTGSGDKSVCVAVGYTWLDGHLAPLIVASTDRGNTWTVKTPPNFPLYANIASVRCLGEGVRAICVAVGLKAGENFKNYHPFIAISSDGSNTWEVKSINNLPEGIFGNFKDINGALNLYDETEN